MLVVWLVVFAVPAAAVELGEVPPDYLGVSQTKQKIYLSESTGRIRIVTFWATWCSPCLKELPVLNAIQASAGAERVQVIAVNLKESPKQFRKALRAYKDFEIDFVHDRRGSAARRYGVKGIPHMLIVDVDGRVAYQHIGYSEDALPGIVAEINTLLVKNNLVRVDQGVQQ
jgi:thiol-disulfide isomerase/thioredoxin